MSAEAATQADLAKYDLTQVRLASGCDSLQREPERPVC